MPRVIFRQGKPNIRVVTYPDALRTSWSTVRKLVPRMWDGEKEFFRMYVDEDKPKTFTVDAMIHIGMLDKPGETYRLEKNAFQHEYKYQMWMENGQTRMTRQVVARGKIFLTSCRLTLTWTQYVRRLLRHVEYVSFPISSYLIFLYRGNLINVFLSRISR